jgi:uncharacterized membrane-anchored protein
MQKNNYVGLRDVFEFRYTPQGKAKFQALLDKHFYQRQIDDLIILDDLPVDPEQLEGEEKFKIKK